MLSSENKVEVDSIYRPRHIQWLLQSAKILEAASENLTEMLPPLGRTGSPVAVSINAISLESPCLVPSPSAFPVL